MIIPAITCLLTAAGILSAVLFPDTELIERMKENEIRNGKEWGE